MTTQCSSALVTFSFAPSFPLRIVLRDGEPWFVAADVCAALAIANPSDALRRLDDDEKEVVDFSALDSNEGRATQQLSGFEPKVINLINEPGLYSLVLGSRKPEAKRFKKWVTSEVLPSIRKTGRYEVERPPAVAEEVLTAGDYDAIARVVWLMSNKFRMDRAWTQGIWYALRRATGTPSPQRFRVRDLPVIAAELRRCWLIAQRLQEAVWDAETVALKRAVRQREDAEPIIEDLRRTLDEAAQEAAGTVNTVLDGWNEAELTDLLARKHARRDGPGVVQANP